MADQLTLADKKDINAALAEGDKWKRYGSRGWLDPLGNWLEHPPDYCDEWRHAGPKMEKLLLESKHSPAHALDNMIVLMAFMKIPMKEAAMRMYLERTTSRAELARREGEG